MAEVLLPFNPNLFTQQETQALCHFQRAIECSTLNTQEVNEMAQAFKDMLTSGILNPEEFVKAMVSIVEEAP